MDPFVPAPRSPLQPALGPAPWGLLVEIVWDGDVPRAQAALRAGAAVNQANDAGYTPLHQAAHRGDLDMVHLLLAAGADPDLRDHAGFTPIDHAMGARSQSATTWPSQPSMLVVMHALQQAQEADRTVLEASDDRA